MELLGNKRCKDFNNDRIDFIANFKHKRRNLYQNFKFKIDCIFYPLIVLFFEANNNCDEIVLIGLLLFILIYKILNRIIINIIKFIISKIKNVKLENIKYFFQKYCIYIIIFIFVVVIIVLKNCLFTILEITPLFVNALTSLFVWGLVEYMSFRYDIVRDVIKERDDCYNAILLYFNDENKKCKSLIEIIEEKGFEQNFYPLTTEYIELFCEIYNKDKVDKKAILDIYEKYKNEKTEFWYYNILIKWQYLFNDKIEEYNGTIYYNKELKNIYDKE